jgi:hypothetical protein
MNILEGEKMKSSIFKTMLCASLLVFAVGCGKDSKSGGGGSGAGTYWNGYNNPNSGLTTSNQQALTNLAAWYNSSIEGAAISGVVIKKKIQYTSGSAQQNCVEKKFLGIPYMYCNSSTSTSGNGTVISEETINLMTNTVAINAKSNPELQALFGTTLGTLISATQQGNVFKLDFLRTADNVVVSYTVDKSYHSLLNPVMKVERSQNQQIQTIVQAVNF